MAVDTIRVNEIAVGIGFRNPFFSRASAWCTTGGTALILNSRPTLESVCMIGGSEGVGISPVSASATRTAPYLRSMASRHSQATPCAQSSGQFGKSSMPGRYATVEMIRLYR